MYVYQEIPNQCVQCGRKYRPRIVKNKIVCRRCTIGDRKYNVPCPVCTVGVLEHSIEQRKKCLRLAHKLRLEQERVPIVVEPWNPSRRNNYDRCQEDRCIHS